MGWIRRVWTIAAACTLICAAARADIIVMKSGKKIEGKILEQTATSVRVKTKFGEWKFDRTEIERIESQRMPEEEVEARLKEAGKDAAKLFEVATYAKQQHLSKQYRDILELVVKADPFHREANEGLGKVAYNGRWYTAEELEKYKADEAERMKAEGKVFYDGRWMTEAQAKVQQGYDKLDGEWVLVRDVYKIKTAKLAMPLLGFELDVFDSEPRHFELSSKFDESLRTQVFETCEDAYSHFVSIFRPNKVEADALDYYPIAIIGLKNTAEVTKFVEDKGFMEQVYNPPRDVNTRYVGANSFACFFPRPFIVITPETPANDKVTGMFGYLTNFTGEVLVRRYKRGGKVPGWVETGIAHYYEARQNGHRTLTTVDYVGHEEVQKREEGLVSFPQWYEAMCKKEFRGALPRLADFRSKMAEDVNAREMIKAFFVVRWLIETKPAAFADYVRNAYDLREPPKSKEDIIPEEEAFRRAFKVGDDEFEAEFDAWAEQTLTPAPTTLK